MRTTVNAHACESDVQRWLYCQRRLPSTWRRGVRAREPLQVEGGPWQFGPVRVWQLPHQPGTRGEPQARHLLGQELGYAPGALPLRRDARGRPWLTADLAHMGTGWSHSGGLLLVGLGPHVQLGVDLEQIRPRPRLLEVAQRFFHPDEVAWLEGLEPAHREHWFFRVWCAKEALLKAHGHGISFGLERLQFAPDADHLRLQWCDPALGEADAWHLHEWVAAPGFRAALAWHARWPGIAADDDR